MAGPTESPLAHKLSETSKAHSENEDFEELPEQRVHKYAEVLNYIYANDPNNFKRYLGTLKNKEEIKEAVNERDDTGKSPLDVAACLGRFQLTKMLLGSGARIDSHNSKGYTCLHHAAAWGHLPVLKLLVEMGGNIHKRNNNGETAADMATRYNMMDCVEFLELAVAKKRMHVLINQILDKLRDDKLCTGRITKDEKLLATSVCTEKADWLANAPDLSAQEVKHQMILLEQCVQAVQAKLNEIQTNNFIDPLFGLQREQERIVIDHLLIDELRCRLTVH